MAWKSITYFSLVFVMSLAYPQHLDLVNTEDADTSNGAQQGCLLLLLLDDRLGDGTIVIR